MNFMDAPRKDEKYSLRRSGAVLVAPFRFVGWLARGAYRVGFFFIYYLPTALVGVLMLVCAAIVVASVIQQIYRSNHDPAVREHTRVGSAATGRNENHRLDLLRARHA